MSNPLNEQIASLITEIMQLEADRAKIQQFLDTSGLFPGIRTGLDDKSIAALKPKIEQVQILTSRIDSQRQKLVSLELLMLDNSIKDLHSITSQVDASIKSLQSTTSQVDSSVKSLQETSRDVLKSSNKLERLTLILVMVTILVALTGIFSVSVVYLTINPLVGSIGIDATFGGFIAFILYSIPIVRKLRKS